MWNKEAVDLGILWYSCLVRWELKFWNVEPVPGQSFLQKSVNNYTDSSVKAEYPLGKSVRRLKMSLQLTFRKRKEYLYAKIFRTILHKGQSKDQQCWHRLGEMKSARPSAQICRLELKSLTRFSDGSYLYTLSVRSTDQGHKKIFFQGSRESYSSLKGHKCQESWGS